ncbi:hypothetical protein GIW81_11565 [Hyphomicrobium sp. xq]|uniref:Cthe-2314-like HEPN domain-containing protein n=1 Tax=Hyphomicrobium album TaxID=2665159 RepID=A0A6I3KKS2_9HYPH|nr:hypothetical protein [Hyphomicrobium album]MTD94968.1 hypothetical protein [Hyphomicrobium album]
MNTPRKKRRYKWQIDLNGGPPGGEAYTCALTNEKYGALLANIISAFEHLETAMPQLLSILLGLQDERTAGYVYRTLRNPNIRHDVLRELLEMSPNNAQLGDEYDGLLSEYSALRTARNDYAHGLWFTRSRDGAVFLSKSDDHGFGYFTATPEPIENLAKVRDRILVLESEVRKTASAHARFGRTTQLPDSLQPRAKPTTR